MRAMFAALLLLVPGGARAGLPGIRSQPRLLAARGRHVTSLLEQQGDTSPPGSSLATTLQLRGGGADASVALKAGLGAGLFALNIGCWYAPLKTPSFTESPALMSLANSFSGGVFLALAFGHLLPHALEGFHEVLGESAAAIHMPLLAALGGYMLIFFVEKVMFAESHELAHGHGGDGGGGSGESGKGLGAVLLLAALGVHSLVETMALGVQSEGKSAWLLASSIGLHQPAESIALLVALLKAGLTHRQIIGELHAHRARHASFPPRPPRPPRPPHARHTLTTPTTTPTVPTTP